jgi:hypothetical protein
VATEVIPIVPAPKNGRVYFCWEKKGSDVISPLDAPASGFGQRPWLLSQHSGLSETLRRTLRTELLGWILVGDAGEEAGSGHGWECWSAATGRSVLSAC